MAIAKHGGARAAGARSGHEGLRLGVSHLGEDFILAVISGTPIGGFDGPVTAMVIGGQGAISVALFATPIDVFLAICNGRTAVASVAGAMADGVDRQDNPRRGAVANQGVRGATVLVFVCELVDRAGSEKAAAARSRSASAETQSKGPTHGPVITSNETQAGISPLKSLGEKLLACLAVVKSRNYRDC